jgi:hypothetical protein
MSLNVLQLQEVGDLPAGREALNCLPVRNEVKAGLPPQNPARRDTKLLLPAGQAGLTTEPPISCRCCYRLAFLSVVHYNHFYVICWCHLSSAFFVWLLCVGCFIFFEALEIF